MDIEYHVIFLQPPCVTDTDFLLEEGHPDRSQFMPALSRWTLLADKVGEKDTGEPAYWVCLTDILVGSFDWTSSVGVYIRRL